MNKYKTLRQLCLEVLGPPVAAPPARRTRGKAKRPYGQAKAERLDLHAQMMRERFGTVDDYIAEANRKPKSWIKAPPRT